MPRGRPSKKPVELNIQESEDILRWHEDEKARKAETAVVEEYYTMSGRERNKIIKNIRLSNGNLYRTFVGKDKIKKKIANGDTVEVPNPFYQELVKKDLIRKTI